MRLSDRVAIVTGAAGGLGAAYAVALAQEGARVAALASPDERLERVQTVGDVFQLLAELLPPRAK